MATSTPVRAAAVRKGMSKVPEVTIWFWVIKILCTTVGESLADYINSTINVGLDGTALLFTGVLAATLFAQFRVKRYVPGIYWFTVAVVSVAGTLYTDILTDEQGVSLTVSSAAFAVALAVVFGIWWQRERTLSIHSITTVPREAFYWLTVLVTFALGTAVGDGTLELTGWTPGQSALLPVALIAIVLIGYRAGANAVLAFWLAYILTRPLGANIGDYLALGKTDGGLGLGTLVTSLLFLAAIAASVVYLTRTRRDVVEADVAPVETLRSLQRERLVLGGWVVAAVATALVLNTASHHKGSSTLAEGDAPTVAAQSGTATAFTATDLAPFATITDDTLGFVQGGQQAKAVARVKDLETAWDDGQDTLQKKDAAQWTVLDGDIDTVLKSVRATKPDTVKETAALTTLMAALHS